MDRSLYILYIVLLDKHILAHNKRSFYIFLHNLYTHYKKNAYQVFGVVARENRCFMLILIPSASLVIQTFFFMSILCGF